MIRSQSVTLSVFLSLFSEGAFCAVLITVLTFSPPTTSLLFHKTLNIPLTVNSTVIFRTIFTCSQCIPYRRVYYLLYSFPQLPCPMAL